MDALQTRDRILDAAMVVVNQVGFGKATLDDICLQAKISKGGFLYHFPAKINCYLDLLDRTFSRILLLARQYNDALPHGPGAMLKAYITAWLEYQNPPKSIPIMGLLEEPALRERLIDHRLRHYQLVLDDSIPLIRVQTVLLICNGLWTLPFLERASAQQLSAFRETMREEMLAIIDQSATGSVAPTAAGSP